MMASVGWAESVARIKKGNEIWKKRVAGNWKISPETIFFFPLKFAFFLLEIAGI